VGHTVWDSSAATVITSHWPHQHIKASERYDSIKKESGFLCTTKSMPPDLHFYCWSQMSSNTAAEVELMHAFSISYEKPPSLPEVREAEGIPQTVT